MSGQPRSIPPVYGSYGATSINWGSHGTLPFMTPMTANGSSRGSWRNWTWMKRPFLYGRFWLWSLQPRMKCRPRRCSSANGKPTETGGKSGLVKCIHFTMINCAVPTLWTLTTSFCIRSTCCKPMPPPGNTISASSVTFSLTSIRIPIICNICWPVCWPAATGTSAW